MSTAVRSKIRSTESEYHLYLDSFFMMTNAYDLTALEITNTYPSSYKITG